MDQIYLVGVEIKEPMSDRADEIAREAAKLIAGSMMLGMSEIEMRKSETVIAAALRAYGRTCRDEGLEEAAAKFERYKWVAKIIRSLKSKPESKEPQA